MFSVTGKKNRFAKINIDKVTQFPTKQWPAINWSFFGIKNPILIKCRKLRNSFQTHTCQTNSTGFVHVPISPLTVALQELRASSNTFLALNFQEERAYRAGSFHKIHRALQPFRGRRPRPRRAATALHRPAPGALLGWGAHSCLPLLWVDYISKTQSPLVHTFQLSQTFALFPGKTKRVLSDFTGQRNHLYFNLAKVHRDPWYCLYSGYSGFSFQQTLGQGLWVRRDRWFHKTRAGLHCQCDFQPGPEDTALYSWASNQSTETTLK